MEGDKQIQIEVAYALPDRQEIIALHIDAGSTAAQAINQSNILVHFPEINLANAKIGIFSKLCKLDQELRDKDRVEIYRPLIADPKEVRKQRAAKGQATKKGAGETTSESDS